ncbi:hypothetical protein FB45DRAFT_1106936 [Roridomyces roridus]|uniref:Zn(2)-C6 fungal-type domain-containing protein n=1 Tax=Roridomyces roridus TaxID=1738132 RepID=A0AAD7FFQ7_9AGAR|nr:hypothetical protein FB45DRAFT_1106936 [Roridomyces roridus]
MSHPHARSSKPKPPRVPASHGHRGYIACTNCRRRKVRCTITPGSPPESPCQQCTKRKLRCQYLTVTREQDAEPPREERAQYSRPWGGLDSNSLPVEGSSSSQHLHHGALDQTFVPLTHPYAPHQDQHQFQGSSHRYEEQQTATGFNDNMPVNRADHSRRPSTFISRPAAAPLPHAPNYVPGVGSTQPHYYAQNHNHNLVFNTVVCAEGYVPG